MIDAGWNSIKQILFRLDPETAHRLAIHAIRAGRCLLSKPASLSEWPIIVPEWHLEFRNPIGLAAGFDKDCEILSALPYFGFGFAEIGTVTPKPQRGNPKPRLFREVETMSLFNRMGFNGLGAEQVFRNLEKQRSHLPQDFRVGLNAGKNRDTLVEDAARDYVAVLQRFRNSVDYVVVNISSPNTPGLRDLQHRDRLLPLVDAATSELQNWRKPPPLLLKLAPDLDNENLTAIVDFYREKKISGLVLTNTLPSDFPGSSGGWSGGRLQVLPETILKKVLKQENVPVISVGGIMKCEDIARRLDLGARLVQIYTSWVYQGPLFPLRGVEYLKTKRL